MLRSAVIGCGRIGAGASPGDDIGVFSHADAIAKCPTTDLAAICDVNQEAVDTAAGAYGLPHEAKYNSVERLLSEVRPEFISIATPDAAHANVAFKAMKCDSVRAVLLEKPIALTIDDADGLVQSAKDRSVAFAVNFSRRYSPCFQQLRQQIRCGEFGTLQCVSGYYTKGILHNGSHWIDLMRFLTNQQVLMVRGMGNENKLEDDPTVDIEFKLKGGARAHLIGCNKEAFTIFEMDLMFTKGRIRMTDSGESVSVMRPHSSERFAGYTYLQPDNNFNPREIMKDLMLNAVEDLATCVSNSGCPISPASDALIAAQIGEAAIRSIRSGDSWMPVMTSGPDA